MTTSSSRSLVRGFLFGVAYFAGAELGHALSFPSSVATFWPPSGLYVAALMLTVPRTWPVMSLAAVLATLVSDVFVHGQPLPVGLGYGLASTIEAASGALLIRQLVHGSIVFQRIREVLALCASGLACSALGAAIGALVATTEGASFLGAWQAWWSGHVLGILLAAPLVVRSSTRPLDFLKKLRGQPGRAVEAVVLAVVVVAEVQFIWSATTAPRAVLVAPPFLWAAFRFGVGGVAVTNAVFVCPALLNTLHGRGPYGLGGLEQILIAQWQFAATSAIFMVTAAIVAERRDSIQFLQKVMNTITDGIITFDRTGMIRTFSERAEAIFGVSASDVVGQNVNVLIPDRDGDRLTSLRKGTGHVFEMGSNVQGRRKDGTGVPLQVTAMELPLEGEHRLMAVVRDESRQLQFERSLEASEQRFRRMADAAPVMIWMSGLDKSCTWFNQQWLDFTGRSMDEEFGSGWADGVHPDDLARCLDTYGNAFDARRPFRMEYRLRRRDGEYRWIYDHGIPLSAHGEFQGYIGSCIDISERKQLEVELRQSQKMEAIGRLAGGVAHDFSNLLTVIGGNADLALATLSPEDPNRGSIGQIKDSAVLGALVTRRLLAFSRRQVFETKVLHLDDVVAASEKMLRRLIGEGVVMTCVLSSPNWRVKVDRGQIEQVVMNLALNARDAMPDGGTLVIETQEVVLREEECHSFGQDLRPGNHILLKVSDTGRGMTPEVKARLFEPFFTTKELGKGTGLGLATVYGIVKQSRGHISVDSVLGTGTVVSIHLPTVEETRAQGQAEGVTAL